MDYYGKVVTNIEADHYCLQPEVLCEYVMQIAGPPRRLIDALNEDCPFHKWNVCLGRSANYATQKKNDTNMKKVEVVLSKCKNRWKNSQPKIQESHCTFRANALSLWIKISSSVVWQQQLNGLWVFYKTLNSFREFFISFWINLEFVPVFICVLDFIL